VLVASDVHVDARTTAVAFLGVLGALAAEGPVVVAIGQDLDG